MKAILLYDENCNFCVVTISVLRQFRSSIEKNIMISFIPLQKSHRLAKNLELNMNDLRANIHLIESKDRVFKGSIAIAELSKYFPQLSFLLTLFRTNFGNRFYIWISNNRYRIFGCNSSC